MGLDHVRSEIEHMRVQVGRQRREILQLRQWPAAPRNTDRTTERNEDDAKLLIDRHKFWRSQQGRNPSFWINHLSRLTARIGIKRCLGFLAR